MDLIVRLKRWIALSLLAATVFAQASFAAAMCEMDRRTLSQVVVAATEPACGCDADAAGHEPFATNRCLAHCTADLQIAGFPVAIVRSPADAPVLFAQPGENSQTAHRGRLDSPPLAAVPIRILLHSFLV